MLAPPDAELAARDAAVAGLATVLDPDALAARWAALVPGLDAARPTYVRYKPGTSCLVGVRARIDGREVDGYAAAYGGGATAKLGKTAALAERGPAAVLADVGVGLHLFPVDRRLRALPRLADDRRRRRLLRAVVPDLRHLGDAAVTPLRYKPERRWVARLDGDGSTALLKVFASPADHARAVAGGRLRTTEGVRFPRLLGQTGSLVVLVWVGGRPLEAALVAADEALLAATGRALAALHAQSGAGIAERTPLVRARALAAAAAAVGVLVPHLAADVTAMARALVGRLAEPAPRTPVHGDFSADQILVDAGAVCVVDLDEVARCDPAVDLGTFAAALDGQVVAGTLEVGRARQLRAAVRRAYEAGAPPGALGGLDRRLATAHAEALLRIAVEPFRRREPGWPARVERLVRCAAEVAP